jgi:hypothetical protein
MSSTASKGQIDSGNKIIEQLTTLSTGIRGKAGDAADLKCNEFGASNTIIERIASARRGYMAWLALRAATIVGKEPVIDSEADASWRAR